MAVGGKLLPPNLSEFSVRGKVKVIRILLYLTQAVIPCLKNAQTKNQEVTL